ncbi:hypothetical protein I5Q34_01175 [Streptomyces sp. AV19]|uniref:hypothetical protein n=1 Tax=Streptomyces sp. AV19 TaxID=2793068 RepID=UPI0018FE8538|nr:hypothetical protein [Streptomyces sp. AV19]MBH1932916.1 hypothetical protein [Streptomyces sp. AV19]MDG4531594.1 hypothetical protein [Streptomyces sp. AV19]
MPVIRPEQSHATAECRTGSHTTCSGATTIRQVSGEITADRAERLVCICSCHQAVSR